MNILHLVTVSRSKVAVRVAHVRTFTDKVSDEYVDIVTLRPCLLFAVEVLQKVTGVSTAADIAEHGQLRNG
jgi:hypothetical protein